jgi:hypothetical protein
VRGVSFRFFVDFKQDFPGCFRGPSGLSPIARIPSVRLAGIIFVIFGRGFWRCSILSSPLLFKHLKEAKKEM